MKWISVLTTSSIAEAVLIAARLEDEGIPTRIRQEAGGALGLSVGPLGQIDVLVPQSRARETLAALQDLEALEDIPEDELGGFSLRQKLEASVILFSLSPLFGVVALIAQVVNLFRRRHRET